MNIERLLTLLACALLIVIVSDYAFGMENRLIRFVFQMERSNVALVAPANATPKPGELTDRQALAAYQATLPVYPVAIPTPFAQIADRQALAEYQASLGIDNRSPAMLPRLAATSKQSHSNRPCNSLRMTTN